MPFDKVETQVDFPAQERKVLDFWQRIDAFEKLREKNRNGPRWSFLDGPITANNPMGVHHAWGRTYKDAYQRYHAMLGQHQRYQNGFDCQGLWVEVEVEKAEGLRSKRDIENLVPGDPFASIDRFVRLCKERVDRFARVQTAQSIRLGYWMDWDRDEDWEKPPDQRRSYFTMSEENNYTIWQFLKKCHQRGLIYRAYDSMPWCPRCSVGLAQMEVAEGYQMVAHRAVFVRFPLRGRPGENLLAWTTTPWTLTSNVAAAVNPELTYLKVLHRDQVYYVAKGAVTAHRLEEQFKKKEWVAGVPKLKTLEQIFKEKGGYEIVGQVKGADMVGWAYGGPFDELPAQQHPAGYPEAIAEAATKLGWAPPRSACEVHRVIAWKDVGETEGTGIVHIAPGCGKEDFLLGKDQEHLPPVAPLDEEGHFLPGFGFLEEKSALDHATTDAILTNLQEKGLLLEWERYPHSYPHCWRCKTELLFRLVDEWFINMSWREEIMRVVETATFLPESINGKARELDWLRNMGDWMISKKRFWGLALPIWVDEQTGDFEVIGSRQELKERAVEGWQEFEGHSPHRPWIDKVKIRNPKTGNLMSRIPDVGNPWLDAGIVPFSTMGYNTDRSYWEKWFPADFITESFPGQFRNWFYAILAMSTMMEQRAPFKVLLGHALVRDQKGEEMHKGKGNSIPFEGAADEGYRLFHERDPKVKLEAQAHRDLPEDWLKDSVREETLVIGNRPILVVSAIYPPMGADVMRWVYCRHNPALNINFGPITADEIRNKFIIKVWNSYAFFCNLARVPVERGGFDLGGPAVPVRERPDMDRWILSDLQQLVQVARKAFDEYNVMAFCLEAEKFVDDKLSNWYIRRSKPRFYEGDQAAYQTLYTVLMTLARLCAPVIPFLTEAMYHNLMMPGDPESIHLCDYPVADASLIDEELSRDMDALLDLKSLGSAARDSVKIKKRQPLAELKVQPGDEGTRRAVERFPDLIGEELNIRKVTLHAPSNGPLLGVEVRPNMKTLGSKFGPRLKDVQAALAAADPAAVAAKVQAGEPFDLDLPGGTVTLDPGDVLVQLKAAQGWAGAASKATQVALDVRISPELARAGLAREVVRRVNDERKNASLDLEDRIELYLGASSDALREAIREHRDYLAAETLVGRWADEPLTGPCHQASVKLDGQPLTIALRKLTPS
ncbi:MAG TPA: class I tRNA ligase family protein [Gemmataceae bacterium]|nr:class I tRNA ligase family protein [Gemmataceae bacterium]